MPTVQLSKNALERIIGKKFSEAQFKEHLATLGTDVDSIEGDIVSVEVFPNRPDLLSESGMGRALASLLGTKTGLRKYDVKKSRHKVIVNRNLAKVRPRTSCAIVTGITFNEQKIEELIQMQEKLHVTFCRNRRKAAIGVYPLEKISWPITYEARKPADIKFTPLEAGREMTATQILSTHPKGQEFAHLLESLDRYPVFVDGEDEILSMPPLINSESTGRVTKHTRDVFIECSGFDQDVLDKLLNIIVCSLADEGGTIHQVEVVYASGKHVTPQLAPQQQKVSLDYVNARLGLDLKEAIFKRLLAHMGIGYAAGKAMVPPYRADILHQIDLVEEVAIAYGVNTIEPAHSHAATVGVEDPKGVFRSRVAEILIGTGLLETNTYNIDNINNQTTRCDTKMPVVKLSNSLNIEFNALRAWMVPSVLEVLRNNRHHDYPQKIFSIGNTFAPDKKVDTRVSEGMSLAVAVSHTTADFTSTKQIAEYVLRLLGLPFAVEESDEAWAIPGRTGSIHVEGKKIGVMGELHPKVLQNWELEMPVAVMELSLDALYDLVHK